MNTKDIKFGCGDLVLINTTDNLATSVRLTEWLAGYDVGSISGVVFARAVTILFNAYRCRICDVVGDDVARGYLLEEDNDMRLQIPGVFIAEDLIPLNHEKA